MRRPVRLTNRGPFARDQRFRLAPVTRNWQRATLVSAVIAAAAVTVAACGGGSGANLGPAALAANSAAATGNGAAGSAGTESGSATTADVATGSGTTASAGGGAPTGSYTTTIIGGPIRTASRTGFASSFPTAPAAPSTGSGNATGSPATVPPAALAVSCPLSGPQSRAVPAGFKPVAVVRCVLVSTQPTEYRREVAVSNLGPLLTALLAPSSTASSFTLVPQCLMPIVNVSQLALVAANGQVIEPRIPLNICGGPSMAVVASLAALDWTTVN